MWPASQRELPASGAKPQKKFNLFNCFFLGVSKDPKLTCMVIEVAKIGPRKNIAFSRIRLSSSLILRFVLMILLFGDVVRGRP